MEISLEGDSKFLGKVIPLLNYTQCSYFDWKFSFTHVYKVSWNSVRYYDSDNE